MGGWRRRAAGLAVLLGLAAGTASGQAPALPGPKPAPPLPTGSFVADGSPARFTVNYALIPDGKGGFTIGLGAPAADAQLVVKSNLTLALPPAGADVTLSLTYGAAKVPITLPPVSGLAWDRRNQYTAKAAQLAPLARALVDQINRIDGGFSARKPVEPPSPAALTITPTFKGFGSGQEFAVEGAVQIVIQPTAAAARVEDAAALGAEAHRQGARAMGLARTAQEQGRRAQEQGAKAQRLAASRPPGRDGQNVLAVAVTLVAQAEAQVAAAEAQVAAAVRQVGLARKHVDLAGLADNVSEAWLAEARTQQATVAEQLDATERSQRATVKVQDAADVLLK